MRKFLPAIIIIGLVFSAGSVLAFVMESPNYRIRADSLNIGGLRQTSPSFRKEGTIGEIATGEMASVLYRLRAGYQEMQVVFLSISAPADVTMSPAIGGVVGGTSNGSAVWTVLTDSPSGYTLSIRASASPSLVAPGVSSFADYAPAFAGIPDQHWSVPAATSRFGFTAEGAHIATLFQQAAVTPGACNVAGQDVVDQCWLNTSTADRTVARSSSPNHPAPGTPTTIRFRAQSGSAHLQVAGTYTATITATAVAN